MSFLSLFRCSWYLSSVKSFSRAIEETRCLFRVFFRQVIWVSARLGTLCYKAIIIWIVYTDQVLKIAVPFN